ncbi:Dabb family protein [Thalassospira alkalitolerans]|uniref:Stress responsive protein n=1 Tax=Thalassospira alkalitolerans TaxID=1293890 RepID=A0A1Y2LG26_9PROT|nr:Dabb family protein [Thalassospira alkalitolerans]OSQ50182.1 stress responsive protein [Thalassospira alkalitolerans]
MLRHIVLLQIGDQVGAAEIVSLIDELAAVAFEIPGIVAFAGGAKTQGSGLSQGFTHALTIDFIDETARDAYLSGLDKDDVGRRISEMTVGGLGGVLAMNIDISDMKFPDDIPPKKLQAKWV